MRRAANVMFTSILLGWAMASGPAHAPTIAIAIAILVTEFLSWVYDDD